ncbi:MULTISPECIES: DUF1064 domain-containing protein [unclassified Bradyrhizobium]|uniref:DUF1064 domain-containing protein n=1 Tax=unclassified Bradyrhizobium TaxID=2631580 RepID=UPI002479E746|nr:MULTISPECIES: DUF1064 domain-containing protein [unclassified Bradyrhizobium]WGR74320.1 DUF1064 domain-containing protein [Bradyrhizobium sp. ISRA426]WGR79155.1 DUF1064 domain-containing protein [Bradyrhizobium sp. ISRA430]
MRWTEEQLAQHLARHGVPSNATHVDTSQPPFAVPPDKPGGGRLALGRLKTGEMNKTEAKYAEHLKSIEGTVIAWSKFEAVKLRLADNTFYTPDFAVMLLDGTMEMHEVKGFWEDDARVKIKVAASLYPFRFKALKPIAAKRGGGWEVEEF